MLAVLRTHASSEREEGERRRGRWEGGRRKEGEERGRIWEGGERREKGESGREETREGGKKRGTRREDEHMHS